MCQTLFFFRNLFFKVFFNPFFNKKFHHLKQNFFYSSDNVGILVQNSSPRTAIKALFLCKSFTFSQYFIRHTWNSFQWIFVNPYSPLFTTRCFHSISYWHCIFYKLQDDEQQYKCFSFDNWFCQQCMKMCHVNPTCTPVYQMWN